MNVLNLKNIDFYILCGLIPCCLFMVSPSLGQTQTQKDAFPWGITAVTLGSAVQKPPVLDAVLSDWDQSVAIRNFYAMASETMAVTPTQARITWDEQALYVAFRCAEPNPEFPVIHQGSFSLLDVNPYQALPDAVVLYLRADWQSQEAFYMFTLMHSGDSRGEYLSAFPLKNKEAQNIEGYQTAVMQNQDGWVASITVPWQTIGGKPASPFGLNLVRARTQSAEFLSPVALDFKGLLAPDIFMEVDFGQENKVQVAQKALATLPSGVYRWQRPALITYPDAGERKRIWQLQNELHRLPTTPSSLADRLHLANRWWDLLTWEGYSFRYESGCGWTSAYPSSVRAEINQAFRFGKVQAACQSLDSFLYHLDTASRRWFADESPANEQQVRWAVVESIENIIPSERSVELQATAGKHRVSFYITCPSRQGIRLYTGEGGFFQPASLQAFQTVSSKSGLEITTSSLQVLIHQHPFRLVVSDHTGKERWRLDAGDLAFRFSQEGKIIAADIKTKLTEKEAIYGFGEQFRNLNHRGDDHRGSDHHGNIVTLWDMAANEATMFGLRNQAYKPVSLFHSTRGYSMFLNTSYRIRADVGFTEKNRYRLSSHGPIFDLYIWPTEPLQALASYTDLTGKPVLPPKWAFEPWIGGQHRRWQYFDSLHRSAAEQMLAVVSRYEALDIPHAAFYAEGQASDDPLLYTALAPKNIHILAWMNSTLDKARQHGSSGAAMHNRYAYSYHKTFHDVFKERRGNDFVLFSRSATAGSQRWLCQFAGDHPSNFRGMTSSLLGGLNLSASGFSTWGSDAGGHAGWTTLEAYARWIAFGCFSPLMRYHCNTPREPWEIGKEAIPIYKKYTWLRENLLDYIYSATVEAYQTGKPMMKVLPLAFPGQALVAACEDEYLFGDDLLIAPIHREGNERKVLFPSGTWVSLWSGEVIAGDTVKQIIVSLDEIPVYLRAGTLLSVHLNAALQWGESMTHNKVAALVVTPPDKEKQARGWMDADSAATFLSKPTAIGFSLQIKGRPATRYLLIYGARVTQITVNGNKLPALQAKEKGFPPGWYADSQRVVVRLPQARQSSIQIAYVQAATPHNKDQ